MSARPIYLGVLCLLGLTLGAAPLAQEHQHPAGETARHRAFRDVVQRRRRRRQFDHAMALLHSFEFGPAIEGFNATLKADPGCAMAHWGIARRALDAIPFAADDSAARAAAAGPRGHHAGASRRAPKTDRERAYIEAAAKLYADADTRRPAGARRGLRDRRWRRSPPAYPDDREASIFWALSLTASALPTDKTYANQLKAGAILEKLYPEQPDHPGITHYIIHSYDVPALADQALDAARRYAKIAPSAPHALHMPSHTFTRVGAWQDSIETNIASADAARRKRARAPRSCTPWTTWPTPICRPARTRPCRRC